MKHNPENKLKYTLQYTDIFKFVDCLSQNLNRG